MSTGRPRISDAKRQRIIAAKSAGFTIRECARAAGVSESTVERILRAARRETPPPPAVPERAAPAPGLVAPQPVAPTATVSGLRISVGSVPGESAETLRGPEAISGHMWLDATEDPPAIIGSAMPELSPADQRRLAAADTPAKYQALPGHIQSANCVTIHVVTDPARAEATQSALAAGLLPA